MQVVLNSGNVPIKHARRTSAGKITGLVGDTNASWIEGYNYQLKDVNGNEFLAELVEVTEKGYKTRITFEE